MPTYRFIRRFEPIKHSLEIELFYTYLDRWRDLKQELTDKKTDRALLDLWLQEHSRAFSIGTGEVEGLYRLKKGVTAQLISEGLEGVESSHTFENLNDETIKGLLKDQQDTIDLIFDMVKDELPLSHQVIRGLHEQVTRHQLTANGIDIYGRRTQIPLRKGAYKINPNNPTRPDGQIHEYCPPESTHAEITNLLDWYREYEQQDIGVLERAAWLHLRYVQIHPFQDGNGRTARLLMAYSLIKGGAFPPLITMGNRDDYIDSLENAYEEESLQPFANFVATESALSLRSASATARNILRGRTDYRHQNRGVTIDGVYHPPDSEEALSLDCPVITEDQMQESDNADPTEK